MVSINSLSGAQTFIVGEGGGLNLPILLGTGVSSQPMVSISSSSGVKLLLWGRGGETYLFC